MSNKPELIELLFINPQEFERKFQELLSRVPNIHSPNKIEFFTHFFLGSVLTLAYTQLMKNIIINNIFWKIIRDETAKITTLKLIFKISDNRKNKLIFRTVTTAKDISLLQQYNNNELKELKKRALEGVFMNECDISGKIFHIRAEEEEISEKDEKKIKPFKLKVEELKTLEEKELYQAFEEARISDTANEEFKEINVGSRNSSFDDLLSELSSLKIDKVEKATEGIFKKLADIYKEHLDKTESAYHGFVYGFLAMNCKYRYDLDCYVERIEGKGYTDLVLISRRDNKKNKNWNTVPVVVEFKAGDENVDKAIKQIKDRGYLYTPLSMRTSAKKGVMVGVNFALNPPVVAKEVEIYQSQGFIDELLSGINGLLRATDNERRDNIKNDLKEKIEKEIKYLYFSASGVRTENYLSRLILGQMLATEVPNGSKGIFIHKDQDFYFYDKDGVRKGKSKQVSTFVIKKQSESFVFSIVEYTGQEEKYNLASKLATRGQKAAQEAEIFENKLVPGIGNKYTQLNIKVEASSELMIDVSCISDFSDKKYQGSLVAIEDVTIDSFFDIKTGNEKDVTIEDQESQNEAINMLEKKLLPHKGLIESESHFQAVMQGLLMNHKKGDKKTLVFTEANPSGQGRIDLVISLLGKSNNEHKVIVIELKYASGRSDSQNKFNEAKKQVEKYKTNLKTFSDERKFTALYMVFNAAAKNDRQVIYYGAILDDIEHTSQSESRSELSGYGSGCSSEDESRRKEKVESQAGSLLGQKRPFSELESGEVKKRIKGLSLIENVKGKVVRLGDMCNQHGDYPQSPCVEGSYNVFINGRSVHRQGDKWSSHASTDPYKLPHFSQFLLKGSDSVFVNGKAIARTGDLISCGAIAEEGSDNVFAGVK
jgi:uncharacterized Zn-binding protein involved in type VI secretion